MEKIGRTRVLVIADFGGGAPEVQAVLDLGGRVMVAGIGTPEAARELEERGIDASAIVPGRAQALELALERLPGADAVVFGAGGWQHERREMLEVEREEAAMDGRLPRLFIEAGDPRFDFLQTPEQRAAYALARAAGADPEAAKEFSNRQTRGHKDKDTHTGRRSRGGAKAPARRRGR
jgi:hypothetical protein